jgi:hypothetical protein
MPRSGAALAQHASPKAGLVEGDMAKRMRKGMKGATTVEVALASVVVLMLILAIIDLGRLHFSRSRLQYAVTQATRFGSLGQTVADPSSPQKQLSRKDSIIYMVKSLSNLDNLAQSDVVITSISAGGKSAAGPGGPGDIVTVQATYRVPILAPYLSLAFKKRQFEFACATTFRNEEFNATGG